MRRRVKFSITVNQRKLKNYLLEKKQKRMAWLKKKQLSKRYLGLLEGKSEEQFTEFDSDRYQKYLLKKGRELKVAHSQYKKNKVEIDDRFLY